MTHQPHIHCAIPALAESRDLPHTLDCLAKQQDIDFTLWICVNHPEAWRQDPEKKERCADNDRLLKSLAKEKRFPIHVLDYASPGNGWPSKKKSGVGMARKVLIDAIMEAADDGDIIVSMDADTYFAPAYFKSIADNFHAHANAVALAIPYRHRISKDKDLAKVMLRYELYLRYYACQLWRIGSPYSFTALGSAIALPVSACKAVNGLTAKASGEDFYFLQKLRKYGPVLFWNDCPVYPAGRVSDRVIFGTGPALIKGLSGDWNTYPLYSHKAFSEIAETIKLLPELFEKDIELPMQDFLEDIFRTDDLWSKMRENFDSCDDFVRNCHARIDGLRYLQFLRKRHQAYGMSDRDELCLFCEETSLDIPDIKELNKASAEELLPVVLDLMELEEACQKDHFENWDQDARW